MSPRNLPPLAIDTTYRAQDFEGFAFAARGLNKAITGEDTPILRLNLSNKTIIEIPASENDLHFLMRVLMEAYPSIAVAHFKERGWT